MNRKRTVRSAPLRCTPTCTFAAHAVRRRTVAGAVAARALHPVPAFGAIATAFPTHASQAALGTPQQRVVQDELRPRRSACLQQEVHVESAAAGLELSLGRSFAQHTEQAELSGFCGVARQRSRRGDNASMQEDRSA